MCHGSGSIDRYRDPRLWNCALVAHELYTNYLCTYRDNIICELFAPSISDIDLLFVCHLMAAW